MKTLLDNGTASGIANTAAVFQGDPLYRLLKPSGTFVLTYDGGVVLNVALWPSAGGNPTLTEIARFKSAFSNAEGLLKSF